VEKVSSWPFCVLATSIIRCTTESPKVLKASVSSCRCSLAVLPSSSLLWATSSLTARSIRSCVFSKESRREGSPAALVCDAFLKSIRRRATAASKRTTAPISKKSVTGDLLSQTSPHRLNSGHFQKLREQFSMITVNRNQNLGRQYVCQPLQIRKPGVPTRM